MDIAFRKNNKCETLKDVETSYTLGRKTKWDNNIGKQPDLSLETNMLYIVRPRNLTPTYVTRRTEEHPCKSVYTNAHSSIMHNRKEKQTKHPSADEWTNV